MRLFFIIEKYDGCLFLVFFSILTEYFFLFSSNYLIFKIVQEVKTFFLKNWLWDVIFYLLFFIRCEIVDFGDDKNWLKSW